MILVVDELGERIQRTLSKVADLSRGGHRRTESDHRPPTMTKT